MSHTNTEQNTNSIPRRQFIQRVAATATAGSFGATLLRSAAAQTGETNRKRPNIVFLLADQWRAQETGYAGSTNVRTPNLDRLADESVDFTTAVSTCPVCCPYRGSLMTGQHATTHGVFMNDVQLGPSVAADSEVATDPAVAAQAIRNGHPGSPHVSLPVALEAVGYQTGMIGKWHLDGRGRSSFIPPERRQGFQYWRANECTHNYNHSLYYAGNDPTPRYWDGYDSIAQTTDAVGYIREHRDSPFALVLSWGTPHAPYMTAPERFRAMYDPADIELRDNVPAGAAAGARKNIAGYYAHCTALDECVARVMGTLTDLGMLDNTIVVFTSDHGDMLGSRGEYKKQRPWDESVRVPLLVRLPGGEARKISMPIGTPDLMPTLLGLAGVPIPATVEGEDFSQLVRGEQEDRDRAALITCPSPFGQWTRRQGGREFRGIRTLRYTYARSLEGPWILYDNEKDPTQKTNLIDSPDHAEIRQQLDKQLMSKLEECGDEFLPGPTYLSRWNYKVDGSGTVPYRN